MNMGVVKKGAGYVVAALIGAFGGGTFLETMDLSSYGIGDPPGVKVRKAGIQFAKIGCTLQGADRFSAVSDVNDALVSDEYGVGLRCTKDEELSDPKDADAVVDKAVKDAEEAEAEVVEEAVEKEAEIKEAVEDAVEGVADGAVEAVKDVIPVETPKTE